MSMGSIAGLSRKAVDILRSEGLSVGCLKLRVFRPFPEEELREQLANVKVIVVFDRAVSAGMGGIVYAEVAGSLFNLPTKPAMLNYVIGMGGRDVTLKDITGLVKEALGRAKQGTITKPIRWVGVRGLE